MNVVYRGSDGDTEPVALACDQIGYPHKCQSPEGGFETQYVNTHFASKEDAWESIRESCEAGIRLSGNAVIQAKAALAAAEKRAASDCERYAIYCDKRRTMKAEKAE